MRFSPRALLLLVCVLLPVLAAAPHAAADEWSDARKAFRRAQKSEELSVRRDAYLDLLNFDSEKAAEEALTAMVKENKRSDASPAVLLSGITTLATFLSEGAQAVVAEAVRKGRGDKRLFAVLALADRPAGGGEALLLDVLKGKEAPLVAQAALALGRRKAKEALPPILELLEHDEWQLRAAAARALEAMAGEAELDPQTAEMVLPPLPAWMSEQRNGIVGALAASLETATGSARGNIVSALERITLQAYGYDVEAWKKLGAGTPPEEIRARPVKVPHAFGIPIYGERVVIVVDISTCTDDTHPFQDRKRLQAVCEVPGARPVPWFKLRTTKQFFAAHAKRLVQDLPTRGQKFEIIAVFQKVEPLFEKLTSCNSGTQRQATTFLDELAVQDGPNHFVGLTTALDLSGAKDRVAWSLGPDEIVLMSCAIPWAPSDPNAMVGQTEVGAAIGLKARLRMVPIHSVGVGPHPFEMMRILAAQTGGRYVDLSR